MNKWAKNLILVLVIILIVVGIVCFYEMSHSKVTVYINDVDKVKIYKVINGKKFDSLETPKMDGYAFMGWYYLTSDDEEKEFNTDDVINEDIVIYAKWAKIKYVSEDDEE